MTKKITVPYIHIENLDALLSTMVCPADEEADVTIVRVLHSGRPTDSEALFSELKAVTAQIQKHPSWHVEVAQPSIIKPHSSKSA